MDDISGTPIGGIAMIAGAHLAWAVAAAAIAVHTGLAIYRATSARMRRYYVGGFLIVLASVLSKGWYAAWRFTGKPEWMEASFFVWGVATPVFIVGALIWVRMFTRDQNPWCWRMWAALVVAAYALGAFLN